MIQYMLYTYFYGGEPASFFVSISRPMAILEARLHMVGTVLCGWEGVKDLCGKAVFPISDLDLFPQGSTKLNGVKFYGSRNPDEVVSYTASVIHVAGGGLVPVFDQLLGSRSGTLYAVQHYRNYGDGGIGGEVDGLPVLVGTMAYARRFLPGQSFYFLHCEADCKSFSEAI